MWFAGQEGGTSTARLLLGLANPGGHIVADVADERDRHDLGLQRDGARSTRVDPPAGIRSA